MKLKADTTGVVIGSRSLAEAKFQTINFLNMVFNSIVKDKEFGYYSYSNLHPRCRNLIYYINDIESHGIKLENKDDVINSIHSIEKLLAEANDKNLLYRKRRCKKIWVDVLSSLTIGFDLKYEIVR